MVKALCGAVLLALFGGARAQTMPAPPNIAAASDLKFALDEAAEAFKQQSGQSLRLSYGSSGNFYAQILQGAPFQLFLSADEDFVFKLAEQGFSPDRGVLYGTGRLVLFAPKGSKLKPDAELADLRLALSDGRVRKFAIANPAHAPYGRAAKQALQSAGLWAAISPQLVLGENVSQAAQFAVSGSTEGGLFAYSLALAPQFSQAGSFVLIPEAMHSPLRQRMVLTKKAGPVARDFYTYLQAPAGRAILQRHGFELPPPSSISSESSR
ncbi:molybdate ABC transporter substrate-binding protein [Paucibacter sp. TC2R-5]|uniref:molybdate ABC transporter substrate-binding protein n=1 Tax=Paucibacter sp. TC2R-5 TaxID=2893555 RepID=UPI0021E46E61|nr:molybdate ABC transporter substrate-binding protein [Paucibacter sp. TC2R-5]MCV2358685.1 molybdate ABC transporter substrate-binding protein [Paucibacter sp. TC2R-5]